MKLTDKEHCYIIEEVFPPNIIAGVTKPTLEGNLPRDGQTALSFLKDDLELSWLNQLHGTKVHYVEESGIYTGDGLRSSKNNNVLIIKTADCLPVLFYDSEREMIGALHMGWRGAAAGILDDIGADIVFTGVGLRQCCYQVGKDFLNYPRLCSFIEKRDSRLYFDPVKFAEESIGQSQVKKRKFFDSKICSFCSPDNFFSYRKTKCASRTLSFIVKLQ